MSVELVTADCIAWMNGQPENRFDLVLGSPPYCDARTYGIGVQRDCLQWIEWMLTVTEAAARVCKGPVIWVAAGVTRDRNYWPAVEGLMYEWWKRGGTHQLYRPCVFHRIGIPGSGGKDWFRADWEYIACFKKPGALPWSDNTACGHPPKWAPGGEMSNRLSNGSRVNQWGHSIDSGATVRDGEFLRSQGKRKEQTTTKLQTRRKKDGSRPGRRVLTVERGENGAVTADGQHNNEQPYSEPVIANPGNTIEEKYTATYLAHMLAAYETGDWQHFNVGGGVMGHKLAHKSEAPFPTKLVEIFVRSLCPPNGLCLDPFSGSGTTMQVCIEQGRNGIGVDLRESQTEIARRRTAELQPILF